MRMPALETRLRTNTSSSRNALAAGGLMRGRYARPLIDVSRCCAMLAHGQQFVACLGQTVIMFLNETQTKLVASKLVPCGKSTPAHTAMQCSLLLLLKSVHGLAEEIVIVIITSTRNRCTLVVVKLLK